MRKVHLYRQSGQRRSRFKVVVSTLATSGLLGMAVVALPESGLAAPSEVQTVAGAVSILPGSTICGGTSGSAGETVTFSAISTFPQNTSAQVINGTLVFGADPGGGAARPITSGSVFVQSTTNGFAWTSTLTATSVLPAAPFFAPSCARYDFVMQYVTEFTLPGSAAPVLRERGLARIVLTVKPGDVYQFGLQVQFTGASHEQIGAPVVVGSYPSAGVQLTTKGPVVSDWARPPVTVSFMSNVVGPNGGVLAPPPSTVSVDGIVRVQSESICGASCVSASLDVKSDGTPPAIDVIGVVSGATYPVDPVISCTGTDALSGAYVPVAGMYTPPRTVFDTCWVEVVSPQSDTRAYSVGSIDAAGNRAIVTGEYTVGTVTTTTLPTTSPTTPPTTVSTSVSTSSLTTVPTSMVGGLSITAPANVAVGLPFTAIVRGATPGARVDFSASGGALGTVFVTGDGTATATLSLWVQGATQLVATEVRYVGGIAQSRTVSVPVLVGQVTTLPPTSIAATTQPSTTGLRTTIPVTTGPPTTRPVTTIPTTRPATTVPATTRPGSTVPPTTRPATTMPGGLTLEAPSLVAVGSSFRVVVRGLVPGARVDIAAGSEPLGSLTAGSDGTATSTFAIWRAGTFQLSATEVVYRGGIPATRTVSRSVTVGSAVPTTSPPTTVRPTTTSIPLPTLGLLLNPTAPRLTSPTGPYGGPWGRYLNVTGFPPQGGTVNLSEFEVLCGGTTPPAPVDNGETVPEYAVACVAPTVGVQTVVVRDRLGRYAPRTQQWISSDPIRVRATEGEAVTLSTFLAERHASGQPARFRPTSW
jgi:hypothetical protein